MLKKALFVIAALTGALFGAKAAWVFSHVLSRDVNYLNQHPWQVRTFGLVMLLVLANAVHAFKIYNSRLYGVFVLGIGSGLFFQSVSSLSGSCPCDGRDYYIIELAVCLILMVDGFSSFYHSSARPK